MMAQRALAGRISKSKGLMPRQLIAVSGMLAGKSDREIGLEIGVSVLTLKRWRKRDDFQAALREAYNLVKADLFEFKTRKQREILENPEVDPKVKAMILNELERSETTLEKVRLQKIRPERKMFRTVFRDEIGREVRFEREDDGGDGEPDN